MDELLLFTLTSPLPHFKQTGSFPQFLLTSSPLNTDGRALTIYDDEPFTAYQTGELLPTIHIDEPLLHFKQTGSFLQFLLTSSPLNSDGRALTTVYPTSSSRQLYLTSSYYLHGRAFTTVCLTSSSKQALSDELLLFTWTSSHNSLPGELLQTARPDNLSPLTHVAELYPTTHTDEPSPTVPKDELYSPPTIDDLSHKQDA